MSRLVYAHMFLYLHVYVLVCVCVQFKKNLWWHPYVLSCVTQSWSSLSFLPGPVLVFRAQPEGPLALWERCWRRPGPAVLLPSPSTGCQAQRVPLASQAWQWDCLHSQRRVWTGQGVATSCWTHTHARRPICTQTLLVGSTHVWKMLQRWEWMCGAVAGEKLHRKRL